MVRARYGTGVFLKLNKRECNIRFRLTPLSGDFLRVHWRIGGDNHYFFPSAVMCGQFSSLLAAVYSLYSEKSDDHTNCRRQFKRYKVQWSERKPRTWCVSSSVWWDEEGRVITIKFIRVCTDTKQIAPDKTDWIKVEIEYRRKKFVYKVDSKDLCYAIARGCTEALKKYGFMGYFICSGSEICFGDSFDINQLLFIKAYALDVMEVRKTTQVFENPRGWNPRAEASSFEKEIELLLFDM